MAELWPVFAVVAVWIIVFVFCFGAYAKWLKVPTEMDIEHEHEAKAAESAAAVH
ncbi:MAG TPA: hypothetical protein VF116_13485 [Ktedonobacterales bacterium]